MTENATAKNSVCIAIVGAHTHHDFDAEYYDLDSLPVDSDSESKLKRPVGRPRLTDDKRRTKCAKFWVTEADFAKLTKAAKNANLSVPALIRKWIVQHLN